MKNTLKQVKGITIIIKLIYLGFFLITLFSLLSYNPADSDYLSGGIDQEFVIKNLIGFVGAYFSYFLLIIFGFAIIPIVMYLCFTFFVHLFIPEHGRRSWDYIIGLWLILVGGSMLLGLTPNILPNLSTSYNLETIPGGAIGQYFNAPNKGWLRMFLNGTGSAFVCGLAVLLGLIIVWLHDWHDLLKEMFNTPAKEKNANNTKKPAKKKEKEKNTTEKKSFLAELTDKLSNKQAEKQATQQEQKRKTEIKPKKTVSKPNKKTKGKEKISNQSPALAIDMNDGEIREYVLPSMDLLNEDNDAGITISAREVQEKKEVLQETLDSFKIDAQVGNATSGPRVTLFEVQTAPGVKVEKISNLSNNIAMELCAKSLRILAPIPGKKSVGIEVPNSEAATVSFRSLLASKEWKNADEKIPLILGRNIDGGATVLDLTKAPHLLIAGATGSGKSVCINTIILSLLYKFTPEQLQLIMVDPKVVEFRPYEKLPHLVSPVITDVKKVPMALRWVINEMEKRYKIMAEVGARNIATFNTRVPKEDEPTVDREGNEIPKTLPFIVVIIDELADIMMTAKADVETSLARIAQLSRAVGIHTIIATQRPSVNVITGIIKANYPTRIAFQVTSLVDSRTIIDSKGAEKLLGQGDMLFTPPGTSLVERNQGAFVQDEEIEQVVAFVANQREPQFNDGVLKADSKEEGNTTNKTKSGDNSFSDADEALIQQAIEIILRDKRPSTSYIQRSLRIGYNRAATIIEELANRGVLGPQIGNMPREILISAPETTTEEEINIDEEMQPTIIEDINDA